ncbi:MAG: hypothetical protein U5L02_14110 [Rheinheimera sp.]|nr:hypothetical protein [Rheinheimera sp.]
MKKAGLIFLAGALSGALLMQQVMTAQPAALANHRQIAAPVVQTEPAAPITQAAPIVRQSAPPEHSNHAEKAHQASAATLDTSARFNASAMQLSHIADHREWLDSFTGNLNAEAGATKDQLSQIAETMVNQTGFYYQTGCNAQFCALLAEGFTDKAQAEEVLAKLMQAEQLPKFKFYHVAENEAGVALRFSIPINRDYQPTLADLKVFIK